MGFKFLRHIARTVGLAFFIDLSDERYLTAYDTLTEELRSYTPELLEKKQVIVATKLDEEHATERLEELRKSLKEHTVIGLSNITGEGLDLVKQAFIHLVGTAEKPVDDGFSTVVDSDAEYRDEP